MSARPIVVDSLTPNSMCEILENKLLFKKEEEKLFALGVGTRKLWGKTWIGFKSNSKEVLTHFSGRFN